MAGIYPQLRTVLHLTRSLHAILVLTSVLVAQVTAAPFSANSTFTNIGPVVIPPPAKIGTFTTEYFIEKRNYDIRPDICLFYTKGESSTFAKKLAQDTTNNLITLWDVWPCSLYDETTDASNPLRAIMASTGDNGQGGDRMKYFENMSRAYAQMCSGSNTLYTMDTDNIPVNGVWGRIEFNDQTGIRRITDFAPPKGRVTRVTATTPTGERSRVIFERSKLRARERWNTTIDVSYTRRAPPNGQNCVPADDLLKRFGFLEPE